jgi:[protein-PII] uridylyltransferase
VWNAWKARLLESLFYATKRVLNDENFNAQQIAQIRQTEAVDKLNKYGLSTQSCRDLWTKLGVAYFARYESDEIAWQSRLLTPHIFSTQPIVRARLGPNGDGIQVMIYSKDQDDLFARICNFFDRMAYNIVEAKIYTTQHGYALNSFSVLDQSGKSVSYSGLLKFIESQLTEKIINPAIEAPLEGRVSRQVKHTPFSTQVHIDVEQGSHQISYHIIQIVAADRPGLLAKIAFIFLRLDIDLHNAKINTLGNRAEDSFLVSGKQGTTLGVTQLTMLQEELLRL